MSNDNRFLASFGNNRSEVVVLDIENGLKVVNRVNFDAFNKNLDGILNSKLTDFRVISNNLVVFYSEKLVFRFVGLPKLRQSIKSSQEQSNFVQFECKPCEKEDVLSIEDDVIVSPVIKWEVNQISADECLFEIVL